jgi:hypothetical protein
VERAIQNGPDIQAGGARLLVVAAAAGLVLLAIRGARLRGASAALGLALVVWGDLWSIDRQFFVFGPSEAALFGPDALVDAIRKAPLPVRVWDPRGALQGLAVYPGSWLMGVDVPQLLGYHGNELRRFDELLGGKNEWRNQVSVPLLELFAVRYITLSQAQVVPGFHQVLGPVPVTPGGAGILLEADSTPPYVRLMAGAVKAPEDQIAKVVADTRFPVLQVAVYPDDAPLTPAALGGSVPDPARATARLEAWEAGRMRIGIEGRDDRPLYLVVAENWYKDWAVTVDGKPAPLLRAQHTLLSVAVPPGAHEVAFVFRSKEYERGRLISLLALLAATALIVVPAFGRRGPADA